MYNNVLQSIENIAVWPVISFVIFFLFFLCLLWWVFTADKKFIKYMEELPGHDGSAVQHPSDSHPSISQN